MNEVYFILALVFSLFLNACNTKQDSKNKELPAILSPYLGLMPPGLIPKIVAPGIIATGEDFVGNVKFSPDMKEIYTIKKGGKYKDFTSLVIRYENNKWQDESVTDVQNPVFSKDGTIIYKGSEYRERIETGWSEPKSMGAPFEDRYVMGISISDKNTILFDHYESPDTKGAISYSRLKDGKYQPSQN